jgi:Cu/Ag efflux protein CusF
LIVVVLGVGFYLGWFRLSAHRDASNEQIHVTFDINRGKIEQDANKARAQVGQAGRQIAQGAKDVAGKVSAAVTGSHQAKGEVVKIDETDSRLTIHTEDNKTLTVQAEPSTKIRRNGVDVNMDSLTEGDHVLVLYRDENGKNIAQTITVKPGTE